MPIIKSAKKRVKQAEKRRKRNFPVRSKLKTIIKQFLDAIKDGDKELAEKLLREAYSLIDTAAKKNIIHKNNAARKKARLARNLKNIGEKKVVTKKAPKTKKVASKKEEKVEEKAELKA